MANLRRVKAFAVIVITVFSLHLLTPVIHSKSPVAPISGRGKEVRNIDAADAAAGAANRRAAKALDKLPLHFEEIQRHSGNGSSFKARAAGLDFSITPTETVMSLHAGEQSPATYRDSSPARIRDLRQSHAAPTSSTAGQTASLRMQLVEANRLARITGENQLTARTNYFIGKDASQWSRGVRNYARVRAKQVYEGVDVVYYGSGQELEYDFIVAPGADYKAIRLRFSGAQQMTIDKSGDLVIDTAAGQLRQHRPVAYQFDNSSRREIPVRYAIRGQREIRFFVERYNKHLPLVIDPVLSYSTYFGGQSSDMASGVALDASGNVYIAGSTFSLDFPQKGGAQQAHSQRFSDVFIAKFNSSGTELIYSTFVGGNGLDSGAAITVDAEGNVWVTGTTSSTDFPTTPGVLQPALAGGRSSDAFVVKLNPDGNALSYSTYLGGGDEQSFSPDYAYGIAIDSSGNAHVTGRADSTNFPTTPGALQRARKSLPDGFVSKLNATGTALLYSTYLGGTSADEGIGVAVDAAGNAYVTGYTSSADFPVTAGALQTAPGRDPRVSLVMEDAFVTKLNGDGSLLLYSTYLGGFRLEIGYAITVDAEGNAYVAGATQSPNFPTTVGSSKTEYEGGFYRSGNGGQSWRMRNSGLSVPAVRGLIVDPKTPSNLYLTTVEGVYKSSDGGNSWTKTTSFAFADLVIDPVNPSTLYGASSTVFKSTDGGLTWTPAAIGLPSLFFAQQLVIDRVNPSTLYATGLGFLFFAQHQSDQEVTPLEEPPPPTPRFFFKTTDGGSTWQEVFSLPLFQPPSSLAMDPREPSRLFVISAGSLFRSLNGGNTWRLINSNAFYAPLVVDPKTMGTLYAGAADGIVKSTDDGETWSPVNNGLPTQFQTISLAAIPTTPTTLLAASGSGIFKSTDAGASWQQSEITGEPAFVAFNPQNTSTIYTAINDPNDAFVAKLNPTGSALLYCTYLGGRGSDQALDISVDGAGNAYVAGNTFSNTFATQGALQSAKPRGVVYTAFVTKISEAGDELLFSTYFGGSKDIATGQSIALSPSGDVYVGGWTASTDFPTRSALQSVYSGGDFDSFLFKLGAPRITSVSISGKQLLVTGENFDPGATLLVNGQEQNTKNDSANPSGMLIGKKAGKRIPPGQTARIRVRNSDATLSNEFTFARPGE